MVLSVILGVWSEQSVFYCSGSFGAASHHFLMCSLKSTGTLIELKNLGDLKIC